VIKAPQRKSRLFKVVDLANLRNARGLSMQKLAERFVPPVTSAYISKLENGQSMASAATLFDLCRIFGSIEIEDELGHRYHLVYRGLLPPPLAADLDWPDEES
jgi:transcriptional regulator with XRE-family HTH domain